MILLLIGLIKWSGVNGFIRWLEEKTDDVLRCKASDPYIVTTKEALIEVQQLRKEGYSDVYPEMDLDNDSADCKGIILYRRNIWGKVISTARLTLGVPDELPESQFLNHQRKEGKQFLEWGRFIIQGGNANDLKSYYWSVYKIAKNLNLDAIVMAMKPKDIPLHLRLVGATVVCKDMGVSYGGDHSLACVIWDIDSTPNKFFQWIGAKK